MVKKKYSKDGSFQAQAIVEFAIVLPILLLVLIGLLEVGRYIFIYSAATNASRNASRFASAVGRDDVQGLTKFNYCYGIRKVALDSVYLVPDSDVIVEINYDDGAGNALGVCDLMSLTQVDGDITSKVDTGDRVEVTVTVQYRPMINFVPIDPQNIESVSARTILGIVDIK